LDKPVATPEQEQRASVRKGAISSRKRAAEFFDDEPEEERAPPAKKVVGKKDIALAKKNNAPKSSLKQKKTKIQVDEKDAHMELPEAPEDTHQDLLDIVSWGSSSEDILDDDEEIPDDDLPKPPQASSEARKEVMKSRKDKEGDDGPGVLLIRFVSFYYLASCTKHVQRYSSRFF
jgi:hypothetical protein